MKNIFGYFKSGFAVLSLLLAVTGNVCTQSQVMAETDQYALVSEYENYTYKAQGKKVTGTRFACYRLVKKGADYSGSEQKEEARFSWFRAYTNLNGLFEVMQNKAHGVLDLHSGKMVIPFVYREINLLADAIFIAKNKKETVFDLTGKKLIDKEFNQVLSDPERKLLFDKSDKNQAFYSFKGQLIASFPDTRLMQFFGNEIVLQQNGKYGIYDKQGKQSLPFEYTDAFFGEQYLSLAKKSAAGVKYGMFTSSDLKTEIFPFEYDYLTDLSVTSNFNEFSSGFSVFNAQKNTLEFLDAQKTAFAAFNRFPNVKAGWDAAKSTVSIDVVHDYYSLAHKDGYYRIFLKDGQSVSDELFDFCSGYDDVFPGYIFFQGAKTLILPWEYKSNREYLLPFGIYDVYKINDVAYSISTDYGENVFRPYATELLINNERKEVSADYNLFDDFNIVYLLDYQGTRIAYDMPNDSLIFRHYAKENNGQEQLFNYLASNITPLLKANPLDSRTTEIYSSLNPISIRTFSYTGQSGETIFEDMPYYLTFNKSDGLGSEFFTAQIDIDDENPWSMHVVLDTNLNIVKPFGMGTISNTLIFENDTVFVVDFYGSQDSSQIYSTHFGKTIYHKDLTRLSGQKYFYPNVTRHGIMNYEGMNGLIGLDGKLIIPFKYDYFSNEDAEFVSGSVMGFSDGKEFLHYFTEPKIVVRGTGYPELTLANTDAYFIRTGKDQYQIYDKHTAKLAFDKAITVASYGEGRYMVVGSGAVYGIFDLKELKLATEMVYSMEEADRIFAEQYLNE